MIGHGGQAAQHVFEVGVGVQAPTPAALDNRIKDGSPVACVGIAHEQPVLLANRGRANGILDQVVVDLHLALFQVDLQGRPLAQSVIDGAAQEALGQIPATA